MRNAFRKCQKTEMSFTYSDETELLAILKKSGSSLQKDVRSSDVRASVITVHIRKFLKLYKNIVRFRFLCQLAERRSISAIHRIPFFFTSCISEHCYVLSTDFTFSRVVCDSFMNYPFKPKYILQYIIHHFVKCYFRRMLSQC